MKNLICKLFGHKWNYHIFTANGIPKQDIRVCRVCSKTQQYKWHLTSKVWMNLVQYTEKGAKEECKGYGEK